MLSGVPSVGINKEKNEVVLATIECDSEEMFKFIMLHLNKYQDSFKKPQRKMFYNIYATFPQHLIPLLIGSGGSGVRAVKKIRANLIRWRTKQTNSVKKKPK